MSHVFKIVYKSFMERGVQGKEVPTRGMGTLSMSEAMPMMSGLELRLSGKKWQELEALEVRDSAEALLMPRNELGFYLKVRGLGSFWVLLGLSG